MSRIIRLSKKRKHKAGKTGMNPEAVKARETVLAARPEAEIRILPHGVCVLAPVNKGVMTRVSAPCENEGAAWRSAAWRVAEYRGEAWSIVCVEPMSERKVLATFIDAGYTAFAPMESVWRNTFPRTPISRPLLPGYVFAQIEPHQVHEAASAGAHSIVATKGRPDDLAEFLAALRDAEKAGMFDHTFRRGQAFDIGLTVKIRTGPYAGTIGILSEKRGGKGKIVAALFGKAWPITAELDQLEAA